MATTPHLQIANTMATARFVGRCEPCIRPFAVDDRSGGSDHRRTLCPDCSSIVVLSRIYGVTTEMVCSSSCMDASGSTCECSCGGVNHSGSYLETSAMLSEAVERFRASYVRRQVAATKAAATRAANKTARLAIQAATWASIHPIEAAWMDANANAVPFAASLARQLATNGSLTYAQTAAVGRAIERQAAEERRKTERAAEAAVAVPAPTGVVSVEGEIVAVKVEPSRFSYYGSEIKMLVKADGYRVWAAKPGALADAAVGDRVRFVAELTRSERDESFAFGKRLRQTEVVSVATDRTREAG
ncbi:MAG: hypothetical protein ACR2MN_05830 [Acidimicrobiales bacterium]